jgi:SNF2 family DNA or RNA helicase
MQPYATQISGAAFLSDGCRVMLADEPRVGKTGAALMALDRVGAKAALVITTSSGRAVWQRAIPAWCRTPRSVAVITKDKTPDCDVAIVSWGSITQPKIRSCLLRRQWDVIIIDEAHYAKNFSAKRTQALYGVLGKDRLTLDTSTAIVRDQSYIWPLTGTPYPNSPHDIYPHLKAIWPERLIGSSLVPDVSQEHDFLHRYCIVRMKKINGWTCIPVIIGGKNLEELKQRTNGLVLRRTQADVGITQPIKELMPVPCALAVHVQLEQAISETLRSKLKKKQTEEDLAGMELELAELRRLTGFVKAKGVIDAVCEEFECGLDKIVIAYWHRDVGCALREGLSRFGVTGIDGSTTQTARAEAEQLFLHNPTTRVFLGQIKAAGEAIDLSSSAELIFAETSLVPADMKQMALRITNHTQKRLPRVRVATLEGSIDETLQTILLRKWSAINEVS